MREQKSDTSENQEITELGYPEPEDSELLGVASENGKNCTLSTLAKTWSSLSMSFLLSSQPSP